VIELRNQQSILRVARARRGGPDANYPAPRYVAVPNLGFHMNRFG
jgi:hypothetical protein